MAKQNRGAIFRNSAIITVVLCVITFALGFIKREFESSYYLKDKPEILEITNAEQILKKKDSVGNDKFVLLGDIRIADSEFCFGKGDDPFVGEFDGNGYTVYLDYEPDANDGYSLFGCIGEGGVVKNTRFAFGSVTAASDVYAGLANINYGVIRDCKIEFEKLKMRGNDGVYSPCVAVNCGTIANVVVSCAFDCNIVDEVYNTIAFGTVCAYNYGTLLSSVAVPTYIGLGCVDEEQILLSEKYANCSIAAVCAFTLTSALTSNSAAVLTHGVYTCDKNNEEISVYSSNAALFTGAVIFNDLGFDNRIWDLVEGDLNLIEG